jgi:adenosine deaminase
MAHGLPIVPHAGETQGADSIWEALELTECKRIGHGIRCLEDDALVNELIEKQVVLEVCPSSNICLNVVPSWEEHPLAKLRDRGLRVTLNSDDPPMFNTTLSEEYHRASKTWGWNADVLKSLVLNAAKATLQTDDERTALLARLV